MKDLKKIELHLHLEGAAPPAFIRGLAKEKSIDIGGIFDERGHYRYKDFWDFLKVYEAATSVLTIAARRFSIPCICSSKARTLLSSLFS